MNEGHQGKNVEFDIVYPFFFFCVAKVAKMGNICSIFNFQQSFYAYLKVSTVYIQDTISVYSIF